MMGRLDADETYDIIPVLTTKDYNCNWDKPTDHLIKLGGLQTPIHVLAGKHRLPAWLGKFRTKLADLLQIIVLCKIYRQHKPDLIYCDRVNGLPAALFARLTKTPTIWRVMGVLEEMHTLSQTHTMRAKFFRFLWRSPFASVICSLDGSGGENWMTRVLNSKTERHMLVNGFDAQQETAPCPLPENTKLKILFAGRIEHLKGLNVLLKAAQQVTEDYHFIIAGYGGAESWMRTEVTKLGLQGCFTFTGALSPAQMKYARQHADIAIACGTHGNMTNTTIEALSDGLTLIIPSANPETGADSDTNAFIPTEAALRYGLQSDANGLAQALEALYNNPEQRKNIARAGQAFAREHIPSWDERIEQEIEIFKTHAKKHV